MRLKTNAPLILYLVHDVSEPAVRRRILMLTTGGAKVSLAGFRRTDEQVEQVEGIEPIDLGQTQNGNFKQRIMSVFKTLLNLETKFCNQLSPDIIVARNLEMLSIAVALRSKFGDTNTRIIYECLDIHRLMLRTDPIGFSLRKLETVLSKNASMVITSSPGFVRHYFDPISGIDRDIQIVENKHLELEAGPQQKLGLLRKKEPNTPWKIGWFGALRCKQSLKVLSEFVNSKNGEFEVILRGIPSLDVLEDFHNYIEHQPYMRFEGRYKNPEDLYEIYHEVDFSWVIDFFEVGQNSEWLLPNRLYESCRFAAVPISLKRTEVGRYLSQHNLGISLTEATSQALSEAFDRLTGASYQKLQNAIIDHPRRTWIYKDQDCKNLVKIMAGDPLHAMA